MSRSSLALVALALCTPSLAVAAPTPVTCDAGASKVGFTAYTSLFDAEGKFAGTKASGTVDLDDLSASRPTITVDVNTIDTDNGSRDKHLRSEDFFFVEKYPTATFVVTGVEKKDGDTYSVTGKMTIRDVTKTITVPATITQATTKSGDPSVRVASKFPVKWKDYGMPWKGAFYAPEIKEIIDVNIDVVLATKTAPPPPAPAP